MLRSSGATKKDPTHTTDFGKPIDHRMSVKLKPSPTPVVRATEESTTKKVHPSAKVREILLVGETIGLFNELSLNHSENIGC